MSDVKVEVAGGNMKVVLETKSGSGSSRVELHARAAHTPGVLPRSRSHAWLSLKDGVVVKGGWYRSFPFSLLYIMVKLSEGGVLVVRA